jgi:hypothetical protein
MMVFVMFGTRSIKRPEIVARTFSRGQKQPSIQRYSIYLVFIVNDFTIKMGS